MISVRLGCEDWGLIWSNDTSKASNSIKRREEKEETDAEERDRAIGGGREG